MEPIEEPSPFQSPSTRVDMRTPTPTTGVIHSMPTPPRPTPPADLRVPDRPACLQCRARKVKCDRADNRCGACTRLELACSFTHGNDGGGGGNGRLAAGISREVRFRDPALTEAGIKRRRARQACENCRVTKAKCSGNLPCSRCRSRNLQCDQAQPHTYPVDPVTREESGPEPEPATTSYAQGPSIRPRTPEQTISLEAYDRSTIQRYIEAFFDHSNLMACVFLHRPSVLADWSRRKLDPILAQAIASSGLQFLLDNDPNQSQLHNPQIAHNWMSEVQKRLLGTIGRISVARLQAILLVIQYHFRFGDASVSWTLLPVAARLAFTMRLNYELPNPEPIVQESRRRTAWAIWHFDRMFSGGNIELSVCPTDAMHIRLPCSDYAFHRGIASDAPTLTPPPYAESSTVDICGQNIRLLCIRDKILRLTKNMIREGANPALRKQEIADLHKELDQFHCHLPNDLRLSAERLLLKTHSSDAGSYILLHTLWFHCHCDLYRLFIPGIRESVGKDILEKTPPGLVASSQRTCLRYAIKLCGFLSGLENLGYFGPVINLFLIICLNQIVHIFHHLLHLLPSEGPDKPLNIKVRLASAFQVISASGHRRGNKTTVQILADTEALIMALGKRVDGGPDNSEYRKRNPQYLPSRGSFMDQFDEEAAADDAGSSDEAKRIDRDPVRIETEDAGAQTHSTTSAPTLTAQEVGASHGLVSLYRSTIATAATPEHWTEPSQPLQAPPLPQPVSAWNSQVAVDWGGGIRQSDPRGQGAEQGGLSFMEQQEQEGFISWDPLSVYTNDYPDPDLMALFMNQGFMGESIAKGGMISG